MNLNEKIFIAGSTGMVGSSIKRLLIKEGYGNPQHGGQILCPNRKDLNLLNLEEVNLWFKTNQPTIVIIAAAKVGGILANSSKPYEFLVENLKIQNNIIETSWSFGVKKLLFLGSSCIYPKFAQQPLKEEYLLNSELEPTNQWYAIAKIAGLKLCEALNIQYGFNAISLMPTNLYGIGDNYDLNTSHVLPALINRFNDAKDRDLKKVVCWGTGSALREFLYVDDLARACLFALKNWNIKDTNAPLDSNNNKLAWLNVGSGKDISIKELAEKIAKLIGYQGDIDWDTSKPDGTPKKLLDSSNLRSLGWEPMITLEEGLKKTIKNYIECVKKIMNTIDKEIWETYSHLKKEVKDASEKKDVNKCLQKVSDLWMFMNRFRHCDLKKYFDEDLYEMISNLNHEKKIITHKYKAKKTYRLAFLFSYMNDVGGASIPHRFMLKNFEWMGNKIKNYYLITNFFKKDIPDGDSFDYLKNVVKPEVLDFLPKELSHEERSLAIKDWLNENEIDFVIAGTCPSTIYALSFNTVPIVANLSQDCFTFTLGPGFGDITFLVTLDQLFKYTYKKAKPEHYSKLIMLPLHSEDQLKKAEKFDLEKLSIPSGSIVSASSNMWKSFFGDGFDLMTGITELIKRNPNYHHIFIGTPRCIDDLDSFLIKNPEIKNNIHFLGPVKNVYRILKSIDFWVNSFPVTGGTSIEIGMLGKPSINIASNRNLSLHPAEFHTFNECTVITLDEFIELGEKFIQDKKYRIDLGSYIKDKVSREFDKNRLVSSRLYKEFIIEYLRRANKTSKMPKLDDNATIDYEKRIAMYNSYGKDHWKNEKRKKWLVDCTKKYPDKPFAWIKLIEECLKNNQFKDFKNLKNKIDKNLIKDYRLDVYLAFAFLHFKNIDIAISTIENVIQTIKYDPIPFRIAARMYLKIDQREMALKVYKKINKEANINNLEILLKEEPKDNLPIYYNF